MCLLAFPEADTGYTGLPVLHCRLLLFPLTYGAPFTVLQLLLVYHRALLLPSFDSGTFRPVSSLPWKNTVIIKWPQLIARVHENVSGESMNSVHRETGVCCLLPVWQSSQCSVPQSPQLLNRTSRRARCPAHYVFGPSSSGSSSLWPPGDTSAFSHHRALE